MNNNKNAKNIIIILIITNILAIFISGGLGYIIGNKGFFTTKSPKSDKAKENKIKMVEKYIDQEYLRSADKDKMFEGQLKGMVAALEDPYSAYMTEEEFSSLLEETSGSFGGIGVVVSPGEDGFITVVSPIKDTPGDKAGIKNGDRIVKVEDKEFTADEMDEAVKSMKGKPGTKVNITIFRGKSISDFEEIEMEITREEIRVETVKGQMLENNIGYIALSSFDEQTHKDFMKQLKSLEKEGLKKLVIDLRGNPGGLLNITADIADEFLDEVDIVYTEDKNGKKEYLKSDKNKLDYPLAILINGGSASASEILAGALKDHNRATLIGTKTFGKGVVQRLQNFPDGSGIKLTISEYFTPNGTSIHNIGIEPDIKIELPDNIKSIGPDNLKEDNQLQKAIEILNKKQVH